MTSRERYYFTREGLSRFHLRLDAARAAYKAVCDENPEAREAGDSCVWHDNFAFEENQRQMHQLARRVREMERVIERGELVPPLTGAPPRAVLGARVVYRFEDEERQRACVLASYADGDPAQGRVSYDSPLGQALLGARSGDEIEIVIAGRARVVELVAVEATLEEQVRVHGSERE